VHPAHVPPGYSYLLHRRHERGAPEPRTGAAGVIVSSDHAGTHIDAFAHQAYRMELCGGVAIDPTVQTGFGFTRHGVETIAPMVARGVRRWVLVPTVGKGLHLSYGGQEENAAHSSNRAREVRNLRLHEGSRS